MPDTEACPGCGAECWFWVDGKPVAFGCGTDLRDPKRGYTQDCLTRQLAQRNELIAALKPVVRAAMEREKNGTLCYCPVCQAVRALTPDQRKMVEEVEG